MSSQRKHGKPTTKDGLMPFISILNRRIDTWKHKWAGTSGSRTDADEESCHEFLINFYGCHLRLQLSSMQLQPASVQGSSEGPDLDILWMAYSSALCMLQMIPQHPHHLSFAQDSVHVMLAYCAAFLVRV